MNNHQFTSAVFFRVGPDVMEVNSEQGKGYELIFEDEESDKAVEIRIFKWMYSEGDVDGTFGRETVWESSGQIVLTNCQAADATTLVTSIALNFPSICPLLLDFFLATSFLSNNFWVILILRLPGSGQTMGCS